MLYKYLPITDVFAREILDSRGNPTIETEITLAGEITAKASVPSGASTGRYEAAELRDGEGRYCGLGVLKAVENVNVKIAPLLQGVNGLEQRAVDKMLIEADGTANKGSLGANAILSVSMAVARAASKALNIPLYQYLGGIRPSVMPMPMMNVINGGKHAKNTLDFQEFMIVPAGAKSFRQGLRMGTEVYHSLKTLLKKRNLSTGGGDEGGFAPDLKDAKEVFEILTEASRMAGYEIGKDIFFALNLTENQTVEPEDYNENLIWFEDKVSILPPARFTKDKPTIEFDGHAKWHIQDEHDMVNLDFEIFNVFDMVTHALPVIDIQYFIVFGEFNGYVRDEEGNKYEFNHVPAMGEDKSVIF